MTNDKISTLYSLGIAGWVMYASVYFNYRIQKLQKKYNYDVNVLKKYKLFAHKRKILCVGPLLMILGGIFYKYYLYKKSNLIRLSPYISCLIANLTISTVDMFSYCSDDLKNTNTFMIVMFAVFSS